MTNKNKPVFEPVAIVGASALFPQSIGGQSFWSNILGGEDTLTDVPADHWLIDDYYDPEPAKKGKIYGNRGAFLPKIDFDPMKFGMPPNQLSTTDTAQLLGLIVASKVIDDAASIQFGKVSKSDISVILGVASATEMVGQMASRIQRPHWVKALRDAGIAESKVEEVCDGIEATYPEWDESTFPGLLGNVVAGRIANRLDLGGTNCVIDAACASSLGAVSMAVQELQLGHSDLVITGGVDAINDTFMYMCFSQTPALSATGDCRPFSANADGTMLGEGIGMVALRRLEDAERDGDKIYAVIRGLGSSSDGRSGSIYAPESSGQALAIRRAYGSAGYGAEEVGLIEAHGTATKAGDAAEFGGLMQAFEGVSEKNQWCALGSVKSQIGHTKSAAGSASLFKVVMALHHKVLPPTIKVTEPNPALEIEKSPFYLNTETRPWIHDPASTRKASVSSFGFGGSNFHVTLEEYNKPVETRNRFHNSPAELMLFSGASSDGLTAAARASLTALSETMLSTLAQKLQSEFDPTQQYRLSVLVEDNDSAKERIEQAIEKIGASTDEPFSLPNRMHYGIGSEKPKLGYLFPGQGSQYVNMGADLACEFDEARRAWDTASTIELDSEQRLDQIVFPIPVFSKEESAAQTDQLTLMQWAQPAIGCTSLSMLNLLDTLAVKPDAVAGHSYGEVSALHAAGVLSSAESLLKVSRRRGELMFQAASVPGSMTAVRASRQEVQGYLDQIDCKVTIANINSPTQVVIAGETSEIEKAEPQLKELGCSFRRLPVATAFHTDVVSASAEPFHDFLSDIDIGEATVPVYSNTTASLYPTDPAEIRKTLAWQLARPVQFQESIVKMHDDGIRVFVEVGPGSVLAGMVKDCLKDRDCTIISLDNRKSDGRASFWNALGALASAGIPLDFDALWENFVEAEASQEITSHSPATVKLNGTNHGKPYPPENGSAGVPKPNPETPANEQQQPMTQPAKGEPTSTSDQAAPIAAAVAQAQGAASAAPARDANWVAAFQSLQQQTLDAQKAFQDTLTDAHKAFLHASEVAFAQLGGAVTDAPAVQTAAVPVVSPVAEKAPVEDAVPLTTAVPVPAPAPETVPAAPAVAAAPAVDFEAMLLDVVADKTGYPKEMLTLDMELESGLGIDSIKRVEILSSLQEQLPHLDEMDTGALAELNTLGEIITFASASAPTVNEAASTAAPAPISESISATPSADAIDFEGMLLDVVAEKTGYPKEMLTMDMELEAGLGIDSIKRVEILSALQDQLPHVGEMDTTELAELNTLGEIISFVSVTDSSDPAPVTTEAVQEVVELARYEVGTEDREATGVALGKIYQADPLYLVGDRSGIASQLSDLLTQAGVQAQVVDTAPEDASWVVLLTGLNSTGEDADLDVNIESFQQIRDCALNMSEKGQLLVTVQSTGGDFGLSGKTGGAAWAGGISSLAKTAAQEWPDVAVKAIDIDTSAFSGESLAKALFKEITAGGPELEVGLQAGGKRISLVANKIIGQEQQGSFPEDSVLVVSGGARGVTADCLKELASRHASKIAILGRTSLREEATSLADLKTDAELKKALLNQYQADGVNITPIELNREVGGILNMREVRQNLQELDESGSTVIYIPTDIVDRDSVEEAVAQVRETFGPITGVVHAAGVLADKEIHLKTDEQFQSVFKTKVHGLRNLLSATRSDPLTHLVCFSSVAARTGNRGQVDYAMANEILNLVCHAETAQRGEGFLAKSIGWGPWAGGMVDPSLARHFESMGVALIPPADGAALFADEITGVNGDRRQIVYGGNLDNWGESKKMASITIRVHESQHHLITSHEIQDQHVVPLAMVSEWCLRIATAFYPKAYIVEVSDLKVHKGIQLKTFAGIGDWLDVFCEEVGADHLNMMVKHPDGTPYYQMSISLTKTEAAAEPYVQEEKSLPPWKLAVDRIYKDQLFHGKDLQVVKKLLGSSDTDCRGLLQMPDEFDLSSWRVAMVDGGLQLALLWERHRSGLPSLPTGFGNLHWHTSIKTDEPITCELVLQSATKLAAIWSMVFANAKQEIIATMDDVIIHVLPGGSSGAA